MTDPSTVWIDISGTSTPLEVVLTVSISETYNRSAFMEELGQQLNESGANVILRTVGGRRAHGGGDGGVGPETVSSAWTMWAAAAGSGGVMTALVMGLQKFFDRHKDTEFVLEEGNRRLEISGLSPKELERVLKTIRDRR